MHDKVHGIVVWICTQVSLGGGGGGGGGGVGARLCDQCDLAALDVVRHLILQCPKMAKREWY